MPAAIQRPKRPARDEPTPPGAGNQSDELAKVDWNGTLRKALRRVTRLRVRSGGLCHRRPGSEQTLLDTADVARIRALIDGIEVDARSSGFKCMCCGNPTLELYEGNRLVVELGFHHGMSLRWKGWPADGRLTEQSATFLVQWLTDAGVTGPRDEVETERLRRERTAAALERWKAAMPPAARSVWEERELGMGGGVVSRPAASSSAPSPQRDATILLFAPRLSEAERQALGDLEDAFREAIPDPSARIRALLQWFGSGLGPWSGYYAYENVAEMMLLRYPGDDGIAAAEVPTLTEAQTEGAARYFSGSAFQVNYGGEVKGLSPALRKRLLDHVSRSADEEKQRRVQRWFGQ